MARTALAVLVAVAALALVPMAMSTSAKTPMLTGTVGPGFTISLKKGTKKVTKLKAGKYKFKIADKANIHNFALKGKMNKVLTSVPFKGTKTVTITLKKGKYTYYCQPHASLMKGSFTVT
jgi:plastocyanin